MPGCQVAGDLPLGVDLDRVQPMDRQHRLGQGRVHRAGVGEIVWPGAVTRPIAERIGHDPRDLGGGRLRRSPVHGDVENPASQARCGLRLAEFLGQSLLKQLLKFALGHDHPLTSG